MNYKKIVLLWSLVAILIGAITLTTINSKKNISKSNEVQLKRTRKNVKAVKVSKIKLVGLGDSLTYGVGDQTNKGGYVHLIKEKIEKLNNRIYRANKIIYTKNAENKLKEFEDIIKNKYVCVAKSPYSFTDNDEEIEENTSMTITDISISNGVGFVVVYTSGVMLMPGLPSVPQAEKIDVDKNGNIVRNAISKYLINKLKY